MAELVFDIDNTSLETVRQLVINANFDEMEAALKEMIAPYANMVVTEDTMSQAKADRAKINKVSASIDDRRKMVKKIYSEPLKAFEEKCKRLTAVCDSGSHNLDVQIKEYEARSKAEKLRSLQDYFDAHEKHFPEFSVFEQCVNAKWTNATYPIKPDQLQ